MFHLLKKILNLRFTKSNEKKWIILLQLFGIGLLIHFTTAILIGVFDQLDLLSRESHPTSELILEESDFSKLSILFLFSVVIHPIVEEISFRFFVSESQKEFSYGLALAISFVLVLFFDLYELINLNYELSFIIIMLIIAIPLGFLSVRIVKYLKINRNLKRIAIFSSLLFALIHINILPPQSGIFQYLILTLPYFLKGFVYSYARVTIGMHSCIVLHALNNSFFFLINVLI